MSKKINMDDVGTLAADLQEIIESWICGQTAFGQDLDYDDLYEILFAFLESNLNPDDYPNYN